MTDQLVAVESPAETIAAKPPSTKRSMLGHWPVAAQLAGAAMALTGTALLLGVPAALVIGGVVIAAVGTLREAGWI